jgi:hypothetical protein
MPNERRGRLLLWAVFVATFACAAAGALLLQRLDPLTPAELRCVGSWAYLSPDHAAKTRIVYHLAGDRSVREEHYYLTSAWPDVPRITMRGKWSIDSSGRMIVEPNDGISYVRDSVSGWLNEYFDNGRQSWPRPALRRIYDVKSVTSNGIHVETNRSGGGGRTRITMATLTENPDSASIR